MCYKGPHHSPVDACGGLSMCAWPYAVRNRAPSPQRTGQCAGAPILYRAAIAHAVGLSGLGWGTKSPSR